VNRRLNVATLRWCDERDLYAKGEDMITILIVLAVLMLLGVLPAWPHSRNWGYGPSGGVGLVLLILLLLFLTGRI
jgi:hypothetical protein